MLKIRPVLSLFICRALITISLLLIFSNKIMAVEEAVVPEMVGEPALPPEIDPAQIELERQKSEWQNQLRIELQSIFAEPELDPERLERCVKDMIRAGGVFDFDAQKFMDNLNGPSSLFYLAINPIESEKLTAQQLCQLKALINLKIDHEFIVSIVSEYASIYQKCVNLCFSVLSSKIFTFEQKLIFYRAISSPDFRPAFFRLCSADGSVVSEEDLEYFISNSFLFIMLANISVIYYPNVKEIFPVNQNVDAFIRGNLLFRAQGDIQVSYFTGSSPDALIYFAESAHSYRFLNNIFNINDKFLTSRYLLAFFGELNKLISDSSYSVAGVMFLSELLIGDLFNGKTSDDLDLINYIFNGDLGKKTLRLLSDWIAKSPIEYSYIAPRCVDLQIAYLLYCPSDVGQYKRAKILHIPEIQHFLKTLPRPKTLTGSVGEATQFYHEWLDSLDDILPCEKSRLILPALWQLLSDKYFQILYSNPDSHCPVISSEVPEKIISWQGPYNDGISIDSNIQKNVIIGSELLIDNMPIGYDIYFPKNGMVVKQILVDIYGGHDRSSRIELANRPSFLRPWENALLENNTLVIHLNLLDLLENVNHQCHITEEFRVKLHTQINGFFYRFKNAPESLHPDLSTFKESNLAMFLSGSSFGGSMMGEHACRYPRTWTGYISFSGGLVSLESHIAFDPSKNIELMQDPFLIAGNLVDVCVNFLSSIIFNERMEKYGKSDLVQGYCNQKSFPLNVNEPSYTGHCISDDQADLASFSRTVLKFMAGEKDEEAHRCFKEARYKAYAHHSAADLAQMFAAELHRNPHLLESSSRDYEELRNIYLALNFVATHKNRLSESFKEHFGDYITEQHLNKAIEKELIYFVSFAKDALGNVDWLEPSVSKTLLISYEASLFRKSLYEQVNFRQIKSFLLANLDLVREVCSNPNDPTLHRARMNHADAWIKRELCNYARGNP
jgi:hypothetical protein